MARKRYRDMTPREQYDRDMEWVFFARFFTVFGVPALLVLAVAYVATR